MFSAELKALDEYLIKALIKDWIQEFKSSADASILFILRKSNELQFCIDYCVLNIMMIKNCYSLLLINKLLNWLNSSVMFSKCNRSRSSGWLAVSSVEVWSLLIDQKLSHVLILWHFMLWHLALFYFDAFLHWSLSLMLWLMHSLHLYAFLSCCLHSCMLISVPISLTA